MSQLALAECICDHTLLNLVSTHIDMLRAAARSARVLAARGFAAAAGAEHTGLVEVRQYTMKPEGIKVRPIGLSPTSQRLPPLPSRPPSQQPLEAALQEFMRLTNEKVQLRSSLLPFLG